MEGGREGILKGKGKGKRVLPSPVNVIDLPNSNIEGTIVVVVHCIGITTTLVAHNALAA
jgi:hypothetical protein